MDKTNIADGFIQGLQEARNLYTICPHCKEIISLHDSPPFYLKSAPDNILTEASQSVSKAKDMVKIEKEKGKRKLELNEIEWSKDYEKLSAQLKAFKTNTYLLNKKVNDERAKRAIRSMKSQFLGRLGEMLPMIATRYTGINPFEVCFIRPQPVDLIAFEGLMKKEVHKITFIDVKTGGATLTPTQKSIQKTIDKGNVEFRQIKVDTSKIGQDEAVKEVE